MTAAPLAVRIDLGRLENNLRRFHLRAGSAGVAVRSHVKGHLLVEVAQRQMRHGARGIAVTHVAEARAYLAAGIGDIFLAHAWRDPWRWPLIAGLGASCRLSVLVDRREAVEGLAEAAASAGSVIAVRVRVGDDDDIAAVADDELVALARAVHAAPALRLDGVHGYQPLDAAQVMSGRVRAGRAVATYVTRVAGVLRARGLRIPVVAVSGTPTAEGALQVCGVTEICAGAYALHDTGMAALGVCADDDIAVSVTATDPAAADRILGAYPYPWQEPAPTRSATAAVRHTPVHPPHVCALMRQVDTVTAGDGGGRAGSAGIWRTTYRQDRPT